MSENEAKVGLSLFEKTWENFAVRVTQNIENSRLSKLDWTEPFLKVRQQFIQLSQAIEPDLPQMQSVEDIEVSGGDGAIPARIYTPHSAKYPVGPGLVFFHGGGFVMGDIESYDSICRRLADASGCRVLSVEYRLAPEHKFPAQINDAISAFKWANDNAEHWGVDPSKIAVAGDSAGGNLSMVVTHAAIEGDCPAPAFQLLIYPLAQFHDLKEKGVSLQEGSFFSPAVFNFCRSVYLGDEQDSMDPRVSPLFSPSHKDLPPAHVITAGWDPLRDEGKAYAGKLSAAGVRVTLEDYPSQPHGFYNTVAVSKPAREAIKHAGEILRDFFS